MFRINTLSFFVIFLTYSILASLFGFPFSGWSGLTLIFGIIPFYLVCLIVIATYSIQLYFQQKYYFQILKSKFYAFILLILVVHAGLYITTPGGCGDTTSSFTQLQLIMGKGGCGESQKYFPRNENNESRASFEVYLFMPLLLILATTIVIFCGHFKPSHLT